MTYQESSSPNTRACVFIDNQNQLMTDTISVIKPRFPPRINLRELITRHVCSSRNNSGRSPNAFIIYRKALVDTARKDGYQLPMTIVSSIASKSWEREPETVKEEYKRLAKEANEIRNKMIPKSCRKRKREKWNIVSFSPASSPIPKPKPISKPKKKRLSNKEIEPLSSFIPPSSPSSSSSPSSPSSPVPPENPKIHVGIPFDIPFDIVSPIIDTFESDDASFDDMYPNPFSSSDITPPTTNAPIFEQQQENWQFNFNNSIQQQELTIGEQSQDIFAFDVAPDETLGFDAFYNFEISYPSFWEI